MYGRRAGESQGASSGSSPFPASLGGRPGWQPPSARRAPARGEPGPPGRARGPGRTGGTLSSCDRRTGLPGRAPPPRAPQCWRSRPPAARPAQPRSGLAPSPAQPWPGGGERMRLCAAGRGLPAARLLGEKGGGELMKVVGRKMRPRWKGGGDLGMRLPAQHDPVPVCRPSRARWGAPQGSARAALLSLLPARLGSRVAPFPRAQKTFEILKGVEVVRAVSGRMVTLPAVLLACPGSPWWRGASKHAQSAFWNPALGQSGAAFSAFATDVSRLKQRAVFWRCTGASQGCAEHLRTITGSPSPTSCSQHFLMRTHCGSDPGFLRCGPLATLSSRLPHHGLFRQFIF